jgi:hypothetical protein
MIDSTFWMAAGSAASVTLVAAGLIGHVIRYAYKTGQSDQRLAAIEKRVAEASDTTSALTGLTATMEALKRSVDKLESYLDQRIGAIEDRLNGTPTTPPRRRAGAA